MSSAKPARPSTDIGADPLGGTALEGRACSRRFEVSVLSARAQADRVGILLFEDHPGRLLDGLPPRAPAEVCEQRTLDPVLAAADRATRRRDPGPRAA